MGDTGGEIQPIRRARLARGLSMREVEEKTGVYFSRIYEWETGQHIPTLPYAQMIAPLLGFASGKELRSACQKWLIEEATYSHSLDFATQEQLERFLEGERFIEAPLPPRTVITGTTTLTSSEYAADMISQGRVGQEAQRAIEEEYAPVRAEWNVRGQFEWAMDSARQEEDEEEG